MIITVIFTAILIVHESFALNPNYHVCTDLDDDCYNYDHQIDPRNQVLDLYDAIAYKMAATIPMPDFEIYASFHSGNLTYDYEDSGDYECICPLSQKVDELYAVFFDQLILEIQYKWTIPWYTENITGDMEIAAEVFYNLFFINQTNGGGPSVDRVNITSFNIFSWWIGGQPLELLEKFPDELVKKSMVAVMKQPLEEKITLTYNNAIQEVKRNPIRANTRRGRPIGIRLLNSLKPRRRMPIKKSKYFLHRNAV